MTNYQEALNNLNKAEELTTKLHNSREQITNYVKAFTDFKRKPEKVLSLSDLFSFNVKQTIKKKLQDKELLVEEEILSILKANLLTIEYFENTIINYCENLVINVLGEVVIDDVSNGTFTLKSPLYHEAVKDYREYLNYCIAKKADFYFISNSLGKHEQLSDRYLCHIQAVTLYARSTVASSICH